MIFLYVFLSRYNLYGLQISRLQEAVQWSSTFLYSCSTVVITVTSRTFSLSTPLPNIKPICLHPRFLHTQPSPGSLSSPFCLCGFVQSGPLRDMKSCGVWSSVHSAHCFQGSSVICVLTHVSTPFLFHGPILLCRADPSHFIHPAAVDGRISYFPFLAFSNQGTSFHVGMCVHRSWLFAQKWER